MKAGNHGLAAKSLRSEIDRSRANRYREPVKLILSWLFFLPVAVVLISLAQLAAAWLAAKMGWFAVPVSALLGVLFLAAGAIPVLMTRGSKVATTIILTLFCLLEIISLVSVWSKLPGSEIAVRIITDIQICTGAVGAFFSANEKPRGTRD